MQSNSIVRLFLLGGPILWGLGIGPAPAQSTNAQSTKARRPAGAACTVDNGIAVGAPKVFDNRSLTLMLEALHENLRGMQFLNATTVASALSSIQGSRSDDIARNFTITGSPTPRIVTTTEAARQADSSTTLSSESIRESGLKDAVQSLLEKLTNSEKNESKLSDKETTKQERTVEARTPGVPTLPELLAAPTYAPNYGMNAGDLLSDQVNLNYQIFNLRMILERSLSDRLYRDQPRLNAVLGFNVSLDPPRDAAGAAAVVEVTVTQADTGEPVSLVALMPQEKTYNAVRVSTKSNAFGGSAVTSMFTVGYTQRRRGQLFYLYRDNDTVSYERMDRQNGEIKFGWQFRPVLGRKSVSPGMRQMFAVIALPQSNAANERAPDPQLKVSVRTYWRKYYDGALTSSDRSKIGAWPHLGRLASLGLSEGVPPGTQVACGFPDTPVPLTTRFQTFLQPEIARVDLTHTGPDSALVSIKGDKFFSGTEVVLAGVTYNASNGLLIKSDQAMELRVPLSALWHTGSVIGRYGPAQDLLNPNPKPPDAKTRLLGSIGDVAGGRRPIRLYFSDKSLDAAKLPPTAPIILHDDKPLGVANREVLPDGQVVFYLYAPAERVPKMEGQLTLYFPFHGPAWRFGVRLTDPATAVSVERAELGDKTLLVFKRSDDVQFKAAYKLRVGGQEFTATSNPPLKLTNQDGQLLLELDTKLLANVKKVILIDEYDYWLPLDLPKSEAKPVPSLAFAEGTPPVRQNDEVGLAITGPKAAEVATILAAGKELQKLYVPKPESLTIYLTTEQTDKPRNLTLQFFDKDRKKITDLSLEIIARPKSEQPKPATTAAKSAKKGE